MTDKIYQIGSVSMTQPAFIIIVVGSILSVILLIGGLITKNTSVIIVSAITALCLLGLTLYQAYIVNCTIVGNCKTLAWVLMAVYITIFISYTFSLVMTFNNFKNMLMNVPSSLSKPKSLKKSK